MKTYSLNITLALSVCCAGLFACSGCVTYYDTKGVPETQLATIEGERYYTNLLTVSEAVRISAVDGKYIHYWRKAALSAKVAPGMRYITLWYVGGVSQSETIHGEQWTIPVQVETGHTYVAKCKLGKEFRRGTDPRFEIGDIEYWIEDKSTGRIFRDGKRWLGKAPEANKD